MMELFAKGYTLVLVSLTEFGTPFIRMMVLSHGLTLRELGFASALAATYSAFELMTDFAIYRFVFSAPRERYEEALASAHALSLLRGTVVGAIAVATAPLIAAGLSLRADWRDFALLGPVIFIHSLEHLAPRVAERDYRYGVQFKVSLFGNALGLAALVATLFVSPTHVALLAALYAQTIGQAAASHVLADTPYRLNFRSPLFAEAFRFGYPLMFNGFGLAASNQGDRFIVGSLLGLPALGVYAIATLATIVPMSMLSRIIGTVTLAALYNASHLTRGIYDARVKLAARLVPFVGVVYALGIVTLMNVVVPLVFGRQFVLSREAVALLGLGAFFRIVRGDPFTSMLLHEGRTRRLALANLASASALLFEIGLILALSSIESVLLGRLLGELAALAVVLMVTRDQFRIALRDYAIAISVGLSVLIGAIVLSLTTSVGEQALTSLAALLGCVAVYGLWAIRAAPRLFHAGFPNHSLSVGWLRP